MLVCWSVKGGVGTSTVAAGLALALGARGRCLLVDLGADQPALFGLDPGPVPGATEWMAAAEDLPADALARLELPLADGVALLPRGGATVTEEGWERLAAALEHRPEAVVVDAGTAGAAVAPAADRSLLVVRACPLDLAAVAAEPTIPTGVVVVRPRARTTSCADLADAAGAPVLAELDLDPAVGRAVDAGLALRPLPRSYLRALGAVA